jgi:aryl-alcohol dehydrogenase-like predicted oxidoreductase
MGECSKETALSILDYFHSQGGNFIDTACNYQNEQSEILIGEWMSTRQIRDQIVLATKYSLNFQAYRGQSDRIVSNYGGNSTKSLYVAVEASLKKLQTSYIDILYVHCWDHVTSVRELMNALNMLVRDRKVLYLGASDCPAWYVAKCNQYARGHGMSGFVVYQGWWSAAKRDLERDIIGLCHEDGMAIAPWGSLGMGYFKTDAQKQAPKGRELSYPHPNAGIINRVLQKVAERKATLITSVALAYVMHKAPYVFPICGGRTIAHLKANIDALSLELDDEDIEEIESAVPFDIGFPFSVIGTCAEDSELMNSSGTFDYVKRPIPITPPKPRKE